MPVKRSAPSRNARRCAPPPVHAVSSRGCSKTFVICFLTRILEHCRSLDVSPEFPFSNELVQKWLNMARQDCINRAISVDFGGVVFDENDLGSYWTAPHQFFTWWKNNVERRKKFRLLKADATFSGEDGILKKRYKQNLRWMCHSF